MIVVVQIHSDLYEITIQKVMSLIGKCEMAQYAPISGSNTLQQEYDESIELISTVEQEIQ